MSVSDKVIEQVKSDILPKLEFIEMTKNDKIKLQSDEVILATKENIMWFKKKKPNFKLENHKDTEALETESIVEDANGDEVNEHNLAYSITLKAIDEMADGKIKAYNFTIDGKVGGTITIVSPLFSGWNKGDKFEFGIKRK